MAVKLSGRGTISGGSDSETITFSTPFSSIPTVTLLPGTNGTTNSANAQNVNLYVSAVSTTQVTVNSSGPAADTCYFEYRAITV